MTGVPDERVAVYDPEGAVVGAAPRSVVRRENLWHAASSIVVRQGAGRIYVHRRTETKDLFPGLLDVAAGGVVLAGEDPAAGAVRELEEELGIRVPDGSGSLVPLGAVPYADRHTRYHAHRFVVQWSGPVRWQPEEVAWGEWVQLAEVVGRIDREPDAFVPDSLAVWREQLHEWVGLPPQATGRAPS